MGLLRIIQMLMLPKVLHLEPTDACNLACPLCARETDRTFNKQVANHLTVNQLKLALDEDHIKNLEKMFMCGNYGDPAAGKHTIELYQYFRSVNPTIILGMNSNGGLRSTAWWKSLAKILNQPQDYVVFSIDGLADTNLIYRKNINWTRLIRNVTAFIQAGGQAHWDMLVYKHNEHQVDACQQFAKELGFKWFRAKVSKRPLADNLEYPIVWDNVTNISGNIECHALQEQSIYIDACGRTSPCCWLGSRQNNFISTIEEVSHTWNTNKPHPICAATCTKQDVNTNFKNQWRREVEFQKTH